MESPVDKPERMCRLADKENSLLKKANAGNRFTKCSAISCCRNTNRALVKSLCRVPQKNTADKCSRIVKRRIDQIVPSIVSLYVSIEVLVFGRKKSPFDVYASHSEERRIVRQRTVRCTMQCSENR